MACFSVETKEAAPVTTKPPVAIPKFALAAVTPDMLSEFRRKRETMKQPTASENEVTNSLVSLLSVHCISIFG